MAQEKFKRKLTTIFSADVAGYSRLMGEDEAATVRTLEQYKEIMSELIRQHRGRVVDSPGDNLLAEFASVVDGVQCAVAAQNEFKARNADLPESRKMQFRIGINLGDVIEEEPRIYGDGVNIAARLESIADPGGICISKTAFDQIETKLPFGYAYLGEQTVKNIVKPVGAYRVLMEPRVMVERVKAKIFPVPLWRRKKVLAGALVVLALFIGAGVWNFYFRLQSIEPVSKEKMAFPLPDVPSIAVLPFVNLSGDPKEDYFSDGLTEQIITSLSTFHRLFVISRNSTFVYKGKPVKIQKVAEDLGVRYVMEGSVQKSGDKVRVTAQLIDAISGLHLWSERYDREAKDLFALQDEITLKIGQAMKFKLTEKEQEYPYAKWKTESLKAFEKNYQGVGFLRRGTKQDNDTARQFFEEALALDPSYILAKVNLASTYLWDARMGWSESPAQAIQKAHELAQKTLAMDDSNEPVYTLLASVYLLMRQHDKAIAAAERAVAINPNGAQAYLMLAGIVGCTGKWEESIVYAKKSMRLDPFPRPIPYWFLGRAYFMTGQYDESIATLRKSLNINPDYLPTHLFLAAGYSSMGRDVEAATAAKEVLRINPKFTIESYAKTLPYKDKADVARELAALRKAGIPDKQPLPFPDKPSIAVLPFNNMSDDPQQEYFSDGISEDIITDLSKISGLIVIARNSSFTYKGKPVNVQQIGQDLGVRYLLEGSVRKVGDQVRLNAQLIDASNGQHLWAERYDGKIDDVFALQDKITRKIISALALKLTTNEEEAVVDKGTDNLLAYDEFLKGWQSYRQLNNEGFARAKVHLEKAVELDPEFSRAYASLAILYWRAGQYAGLQQGLGLIDVNSMQVATVKSHLLLKKAMKKPTALAYGMMSQIYLYRFLHNKALAAIEQAIAMDPNDPDLYAWMSNILWFMGENSRAIESAQRAQRLDPNNPALYLFHLGSAYAPDGDLQESLALLEKSRRLNPEFGAPILRQSVIYALQGRIEEARATLQIFIMRRAAGAPLNLKVFMAAFPFADPKTSDRIAEALVKAGVPAKPADYCRLSKENLLNGHEIKSLLFGHRITGISLLKGGDQFWYEWTKDGKFQFTRGAYQYGGKYWVEEEVLFTQSDNLYAGLPYGSTIFRNPGGTKEDKNEYVILTDLAFMLSFSLDE